MADFFDEERVDAAIRIVTRNARQSAVNHQPDPIDGEGRFGDIGGNDDLALLVARDGGILVARGKFAVQRKQDEAAGFARVPDGLDGLRNLESAGHENQHVTLAAGIDVSAEGIGGLFPNRTLVGVRRVGGVFNFDGEGAAFRSEHGARLEVRREQIRIECRGHHGQAQVGPGGGGQVERTREGDVPIEMALVKFVEEQHGDAGERRIIDHLAEQDPFGDKANPCFPRGDILEANLITNLATELDAEFLCHAGGKQAGGEPAGLQDDGLATIEEPALQ